MMLSDSPSISACSRAAEIAELCPGATQDAHGLVLWRWSAGLTCSLAVIFGAGFACSANEPYQRAEAQRLAWR